MTTDADTADRIFSIADQVAFAAFSGDRNPLHVDAVAARRTAAGAPVVHGMHLLLWSLETALAAGQAPKSLKSIRGRFSSPLVIGERAELSLQKEASETTIRISVGDTLQSKIELRGESDAPITVEPVDDPARILSIPANPLACPQDQALGCSGRWLIDDNQSQRHFPICAGAIGPNRIAAIGFLSTLVGMICPGLHSLLGSTTIDLNGPQTPFIDYRVVEVDERFDRIVHHVAGGGIMARVEAFYRSEPVAQQSMAQLSSRVAAGEFAGATALIVGGSRGLGALTAKLLAAGGARIILTYATGAADAKSVQGEIQEAGGICEITQFNAIEDTLNLPAKFPVPTHVYYFATPTIWLRRSKRFSIERFNHFAAYYVTGLEKLVYSLDQYSGLEMRLFNPSSVFVTDGPAGLVEYSMAKAASETLAGYLARSTRVEIFTHRLPRLLTDQTAAAQSAKMDDAAGVMLPLIRDFQTNDKVQ